MKKTLALVLALLLALSVSALAESAPISVVDGLGRTVELAAAPQKLVSLTPANTEILFALGLGDKVVGVDASSDYPPEAASCAIVGDYSGPNLEAIVAAEPDVVFASTKLQQEAIEEMEKLGLTVICNEPNSYNDIAVGVQLIADATGADASAVLAAMDESKTAALAALEPRETPLKVYVAISFGEAGDFSVGPGTFIDDMLTMSGAINVASQFDFAWPMYSIEQLVLDDPDVILVSDYTGDGSLLEQFKAAQGYKDLRCVQEGHVYALDANTSSRPAPRINEALAQIVAVLNAVE